MDCSLVLKAVQHCQVKLTDISSLIKFMVLIRYHFTVVSVFRKVEAHAEGFKKICERKTYD